MMSSRRRLLAALLSSLVLAATLVGLSAPAQAQGGPHIYGYVTDASGKAASTMTVRLFRSDADDSNWTYLRKVNVSSKGIYDVETDGAGRYHLQLVERRPAYDTRSYARVPNVNINVATTAVVKNVVVKRGGAVGGTIKVRVKSHGKYRNRAAGSAKVRAISDDGQIYEVTADKSGRYALGGLPKNNYRVYAYDKRNRRVGTSKLARKVELGSFRKVSFVLRTSPASYQGFLTTGGTLAKGSVTVTAVNQRTGEYWVTKVSGGALSLTGLTPGRYVLTVPDTGGYFGRTVTLPSLRAGQTRRPNVVLPTKAGTFSGTVVDATSGNPIPNVSIQLKDKEGRVQQELTASSTGTFSIGGTLRAQSGVTVTIFAYDKIGEHYYLPRSFTGLEIVDDRTLDLDTISGDTLPSGARVIKLQRKPVTSTPAPTTPTPTTSAPTTPAPTPTATTPAP
jgi:5-hydroxyisourate hydrolase-like protein (transthyretin family)